jgi:hypothetical protein
MSTSVAIKVQQDSTITLSDGDATPNTLVVPYVDGAASFDGLNFDQTEPIVIYSKRTYLGIRRGAARPITFSFTAYMAEFTSATQTSLLDFIRFSGGSGSNVSTSSTDYDFSTIKITLTVAQIGNDTSTHTLVLDDCACDVSFAEGEPNQFSVSGTAYGSFSLT